MIDFGDKLKTLVESYGIEVTEHNSEYKTLESRRVVKKSSLQDILDSMSISKEELEQLETGGGIEIGFQNDDGCPAYSTDLTFTEEGLFFKGRRVVLYISKAYYENSKSTPVDKLHKYHLHFCKALRNQKNKGNLEKYRVSLSKKGEFHYAFSNRNGGVVPNQKLNVCGYCSRDLKNQPPRYFNLQDFLETSSQEIPKSSSPKLVFDGLNISGMDMDYNEVSAEYRDDWREISIARKKAKNYTCEECGWSPKSSKEKQYIHTHHIDKNKSNSLSSNLKVLCIDCHYNYHPTLKGNAEHEKFLEIK
jgi:hypothetical protein